MSKPCSGPGMTSPSEVRRNRVKRPTIFLRVWKIAKVSLKKHQCAADFSLLNLPKGKSLGRSKPATSSYAQAPQHTVWDDFYYIQALLNCLL